jgi:hypothetical protein
MFLPLMEPVIFHCRIHAEASTLVILRSLPTEPVSYNIAHAKSPVCEHIDSQRDPSPRHRRDGCLGVVEFCLLAIDHRRDELRVARPMDGIGAERVESLAGLAGDVGVIGWILVAEFLRIGGRRGDA